FLGIFRGLAALFLALLCRGAAGARAQALLAAAAGEAHCFDRQRAIVVGPLEPGGDPGDQEQQRDGQQVQRERRHARQRRLVVRRVALPEALLRRDQVRRGGGGALGVAERWVGHGSTCLKGKGSGKSSSRPSLAGYLKRPPADKEKRPRPAPS